MKRLLSTLTALCMCASLSASMLPASALNAISPENGFVSYADEKAHDKGYEWCIEDTTYDPAVGGQITVKVNVYDDPGTNGYAFTMAVDGKAFSDADCPFKVVAIKDPFEAYETFEQFVPNIELGRIGASASGTGEDEAAPAGSTAVQFVLEAKEGATFKAGDKYELTFKDSKFGNAKDETLNPTLTEGYIVIAGEPDSSEDPSTEPSTDPSTEPSTDPSTEPSTDPTQPSSEDKNHDKGYEWCIEDTTYDPTVGGQITVKVNVYDDPGTNGYAFTMAVDGKAFSDADCPFKVVAIKDPFEAYETFEQFVPNIELGRIGASASGTGEDEAAPAGSTAVQFVLEAKEGATFKAGDKYELTFKDSKFGNAKDETLNPTLTPGYITIAGAVDPTEPSTDPTDPSTDPTDPSTDPTDPSTDPTNPGDYIYGDVNKNGEVELVDIVMLNRFLTGYDNQDLDDYQTVVANCSRSGESDADTTKEHLNGQDSIEILKYLIGLVTSLPNNA